MTGLQTSGNTGTMSIIAQSVVFCPQVAVFLSSSTITYTIVLRNTEQCVRNIACIKSNSNMVTASWLN